MSDFRPTFVVCLAAAAVLLAPRELAAGEWHNRTSSGCTDCHTQHNSENGQPMRTDMRADPAPLLLRRATPLELCVSCHDGSNPSAPDVIAPVSYVVESAAGAFPNAGGIAAANAHHLNNPTAEVPPGGSIPMVLTCTTCHDPHGNGSYRNLRPDPTRQTPPDVTLLAKQSVVADGGNAAAVYIASNVVYKSGVSAWCGKCHGAVAGSHTVDKPMFGSTSASYAAWVAVTLPRVPVLSPADDNIPSEDDQVTCLSCHKAHGSANPNTLIYADSSTLDSTCQECHNQ